MSRRTIYFDRTDPESLARALEDLQAMYADDKAAWQRERRALQKQVSVHEQLRDARARVRVLESVVEEVIAWHSQLYRDGGGLHADLHTILLRAKAGSDP